MTFIKIKTIIFIKLFKFLPLSEGHFESCTEFNLLLVCSADGLAFHSIFKGNLDSARSSG